MPDSAHGDGLAELLASLDAPLRFLRDAEPGREARVRLPLAAWLERLRVIASAEEPGPLRDGIGGLVQILEKLGRAEGTEARRFAGSALDAVHGIRSARPSEGAPATSRPRPVRVETGGERAREPVGGSRGSREGGLPGLAAPAAGVTGSAEVRPAVDASIAEVEAWLAVASSPTSAVPGVGPARARELERFELPTVEDLLYHLPFRYEDRRARRLVREMVPGESATAKLEIRRVDERRAGPGGRRTVLSVTAGDETGVVELVWFNQVRWFRSRLKRGDRWIVHGKVERGYQSSLRITHPEMESVEDRDESESSSRVLPVYEKPTAMPASAMRRVVHAAVDAFAGRVPDAVPAEIRRQQGLLSLGEALREVHRPGAHAQVGELGAFRSAAHRAIVFDEFFFVQLGLLLRKAEAARETGIAFAPPGTLVERLFDSLPFPLTGAQRRVIGEIAADQAKPHPMHRLLQGDVGSGKTVVAVAASLRAIECGWQAVVMAPTELLAEQHWETIRRVAGGLGVPLWYLSGEVSAAARREVLGRLEAGEAGLVVGTHALIQEGVRFGRLGLAVIDEQHRFGVMQRAGLARATGGGSAPDVLLMSATPIPRTRALSLYGDLDLSWLDEMPPGRKPVHTTVHGMNQRRRAYEVVRREIAAGRQAFVVYPLIEESEASDLRDATSAADELRAEIFPDLRIALVHGRMPAAERDATMRDFKERRYDLLVATTVIEVGIDVPNASVIVIEHAERFGLAQLHQLRGRVGRGADEAYCLLVADWAQSKEAKERLAVMTETNDGLRIAEADMAIRGAGTLLGTRQSGQPDFRVASLERDGEILEKARAAAKELLDADPSFSGAASRVVRRVLEARWKGRLSLARIG